MSSRASRGDPDADGVPINGLLTPLGLAQFDSVDYLNENLPSLPLSTQSQASAPSRPALMQIASADIQTFLARLNAHNIRASSELTSMTDEILRGGNRLAYEVELLRGDINSLYDLLTDTLREDIQHFIHDYNALHVHNGSTGETAKDPGAAKMEDPVFITQLRMLGQVKARLESVVGVFGEAMKWSVPPSELAVASSLISVAAPELGTQNTEEDDKARESAKAIRNEIQDLLDADGGGYAGLEAATNRVAQYKDLASIWKGTTEERVRTRFVESLIRQLDDRKKALHSKELAQRTRTGSAVRSSSAQGWSERADGGGLFRNLARLKDDFYLE